MTKPETITISIPASQIEDVDIFEAIRLQAHKKHDHSSLTALAESTSLVDGNNLYDQFASVLDAEDPTVIARKEAKERAERLSKAAQGSVFYDLVLGADAEVHDIVRHVMLPEDESKTRAQKRMAAQVPYGRKQNDSSFRTRT